jgi:uracil phosphoribosyltransferase
LKKELSQTHGKSRYFHHPLVKHKTLSPPQNRYRSQEIPQLIREITLLLAYEATQDLLVEPVGVTTPLTTTTGYKLKEPIGLIPSCAPAGDGGGYLGDDPLGGSLAHRLFRDEQTLRPVAYYNRLPIAPTVSVCLILDPMLATGGSAVKTVEILKDWGARRIKFMGLIAAPEGVAHLSTTHPDVDIHVAAVDERLNEHGYIVPGLGDAGDRQFGTG